MKVSRKQARDLIAEISAVVDIDINIMDDTGTIVASTDDERIDQFHEGAQMLIRDRRSELIVHYDNEFRGCRKGINLPLIYKDKIIGVIGLTGEIEETIHYARLIQKMTELLMRDLVRIRKEGRKDQEKMLFINSWISGEIESRYEIEEFLENNGVDPQKPMLFALMEMYRPDDRDRSARRMFENRISPPGTIICNREGSGIMVGNFTSPEKCMECIMTFFSDQYPMENYICGIGDLSHDCDDAVHSYHQALKVLQVNRDTKPGVYMYNDSILEIILSEIPKTYKDQLFIKVFGKCRQDDIPDIMEFIKVYNKNNGSINGIASEMCIHKNTVQYKINKLHTQTGLDLRVTHDNMILYLLELWYGENKYAGTDSSK